MPATATWQPERKGSRHVVSPGRSNLAGWAAATVASLAVIATVVGSAILGFGSSAQGHLTVAMVVWAFTGVILVVAAAWVVGASRPAVAIGLAVTAISLIAPAWAMWPLLPTWMRSVALATTPLAVAGAAQVALGWSRDAGPRRALGVVYLLVGVAAAVHVLAYNPFAEPRCATVCIDLHPVAGGVLDSRQGLAVTATLTAGAALSAAVAMLRRPPPRAPDPVAGAVLATMTAIVLPLLVRWVRWGDQQVSGVLMVLPAGTAALAGAAVTAVTVQARQARASMMRLVAHLSDSNATETDLGSAVGDVQFAVPDEERWVDAMGRPAIAEPEDDRYVVVAGVSGPVLRLRLGGGRGRDDVAEALTPAMRLALMNAQLAAVTRARVAEVQASRRRIVATADAERQRIERDLHDGAQQRLVGAAFYLKVAQGHLPEDAPSLAEARVSVYDALSHLRRLAHGIFPSVLVTEGLWGALDELARTSLVPIVLEVDGTDEVHSEAAMAVYALVATGAGHAEREPSADSVAVSVRRGDGTIEISVATAAGVTPPDMVDVADRIGALGGDMTISATPGGVEVQAVIPCAS